MVDYKIRILTVILVMLFTLSGCAQIKDKFIRKPKEEKTQVMRYYAVKKYDIHPSLELYKKRYILWKVWHNELLGVIRDSNHKKKMVAIEQEISNLIDMHNMLVDEKAEKLQKIITEMTEIEAVLKKQKITSGKEVRVRRKLESLGRQIKREFNYNKMQEFIRSDFKK